MSMLGPNTCSDSSLCQLHISIYKLSPSALRCHVGVVSSVCFYFAILLHWVLLNTGESALIRDQPLLKHSFITVESREELHNYAHPHQGWLFAFSLLVNLRETRSVMMQIRMTPVFGNMKKISSGRIFLFAKYNDLTQWQWCSDITNPQKNVWMLLQWLLRQFSSIQNLQTFPI